MKKRTVIFRVVLFITGLFIMAFGVALSVNADLGVSPISCIPYVFFYKFSMTLGTLTILFNLTLILLQIAILRKNYRLIQLLQLPVVIVFGVFIDVTLYLISDLSVPNYYSQAFWCLISCTVLGFGIFLEVKAKLTYLPGEGLAVAISETYNVPFGKAKVGVDSVMVIVGLVCSFVFLKELKGIREGTIFAAISVGYIAKFYQRKIHIFDSWLESRVDNS